jgi:5'-3' exoribonuclease 2
MRGDLKFANLYHLRGTTITGDVVVISNSLSTSDATNLWHMRELGLAVLSKRGLLDGHSISKLDFCEHCVFGKQKRVKFNTATHSSKGILDYVHSDLWEPSRKPSLGGAHYMLTIIDDYSRKVWPYFMKDKQKHFQHLKSGRLWLKTKLKRRLKSFVLIVG